MTTLAANLSDSATEMRVNVADPTPAPYYQIDDEIVRLLQNSTTVQVGAVSPNRELDLTLWQIERGDAETTPAAHLSGATLEPLWPQVPGAGGPGESVILSATVELTDAQIKALPTTPFTVLAAGGPGTILHLLSAVLHFDWTADYSNVDATAFISLDFDSSFYPVAGRLEESASAVTGLLASGEDTVGFLPAISYDQGLGGDPQGTWQLLTDVVDQGLAIRLFNAAAGALTGGNAANTLKVTVLYAVIDL